MRRSRISVLVTRTPLPASELGVDAAIHFAEHLDRVDIRYGTVTHFDRPVVGLDWDSNWQPQVIPEFDCASIIERLRTMYEPVRTLFHDLCTDELKETFT
jgi:uncharacterized protein (TIGR04255 family)